MDEKPKNALDWIRWAREKKEDEPDQEQPAPVPTGPSQAAPQPAPPQPAPPPPAAPPQQAAPAPVAVQQAPPAPPASQPPARDVADLEDPEELAGLGDEDDFDRLMAHVPVAESFADPEPAPPPPAAAAPEPIPEPDPLPEPDPIPEPPAAAPDLPQATNSTVVIPADCVYTFHPADFNFVEAEGHELSHVEILALAGEGSLRFDHEGVSMGQKISRADIEAGKFTFIPSSSGSVGHDSFLYKVHDGTGSSRVAYTMTIQTQPV